ncbi:hypothetical protein CR513_53217, partial [Mucuna pruriens]
MLRRPKKRRNKDPKELQKDETKLRRTNFLTICNRCRKYGHKKITYNKSATRSIQLLEIVHTHICDSFYVNSFGKKRYFITFIDDYSRYDYVYILHKKSQVVNVLEIYLNEVEKQLDRKIKR